MTISPVRRALVALVASRGYTVFEAADGHEAWQQLLRMPADVVVSDLQMPRCDGRELCRRIRTEPSMRHIGVLIVTGCTELEERYLSCDGILSKPVSAQIFFREIERVSQRVAET